jgi:nucleoside-diphosphate-sugar epimerase
MGESIALTHGSKVKIARLSNVVGLDLKSDNFLMSVVRDCLRTRDVEFKTSMDSSKDYVSVDDVADILLRLGVNGRHSIYNVGSGTNATHRDIAARLGLLTGSRFRVAPRSSTVAFPPINIERLKREFQFEPKGLDSMICSLVSGFRSHYSNRTVEKAA